MNWFVSKLQVWSVTVLKGSLLRASQRWQQQGNKSHSLCIGAAGRQTASVQHMVTISTEINSTYTIMKEVFVFTKKKKKRFVSKCINFSFIFSAFNYVKLFFFFLGTIHCIFSSNNAEDWNATCYVLWWLKQLSAVVESYNVGGGSEISLPEAWAPQYINILRVQEFWVFSFKRCRFNLELHSCWL